jgi:two-component system, NtrC family, response regulator
MAATVLVVDDDVSVTASLALLLKQAGYKHLRASNPDAALAVLSQNAVDLVIQDMNFARSTTGEEGLRLLRAIRSKYSRLPVVLITAWGSIAIAVEGMKSGAADFVTKPWDNARLLQVVRTALSLAHGPVPHPSRASLDANHSMRGIVGVDPTLLNVLSRVARVAKTEAGVLITGESGTGKELLADAIHKNSARVHGPIVKVNMGAIVPSLFDSEMFGHARGAFTDARTDRVGFLEKAHGGTLFLDEIGELDLASQVKLLRVVQEQEFRRVGCSEVRKGNFRVIAATNRDLPQLVAEGRFREDLYYRLNLITLELPPLRARSGDIRLIAVAHLQELATRYGLQSIGCDADAFEWLVSQPWPGNIRQLKHTIERAFLLSGAAQLSRSDLIAAGATDTRKSSDVPVSGGLALSGLEKVAIQRAMEQSDQNITRAAELLGLTRAALYRRLAKHGLLRE